MALFSPSKSNSIVGLDVGTDSIAATEVRANGTVEVVRQGIMPLEPGVFREGEVVHAESLSDALKELFSANKLAPNVRLGIANQRLAVRVLRLPAIADQQELEAAIRFQAQDSVPMPLEQAVLDWQVIGTSQGASGEAQLDVVVVAARRDMIDRMLAAMRGAGLRPVGIDVSAFGLVRALAHDPQLAAAAPAYEQRVAAEGEGAAPHVPARLLCHFGDVTNLAVAQGTNCLFTRMASFGLEGMAQRLAERRELTLEHARQWLAHVGLAAPVEEIEGDPEHIAAARAVLEEGVDRLADEIRVSVEYYNAQEGAVALEGAVASGPGTTLPGLVDRLQASLGYPFVTARPAALGDFDELTAARLTLSFGLALES
jgi:type IV pilus assembly protein PilM